MNDGKLTFGEYTQYLFSRATGKGIPLSGTFELTSRCNLDCRMCYIHRRANDAAAMRAELSTAQWIEWARTARDRGMLFLLLTGGEPLLRRDFREIYTACRRMGILLQINTNGTLINEEMADFLAANPPTRVNLTLYGATPEAYGRVCGDEKACARAFDAVRMLNERGIRMKINISAVPQNVHELPALYAFCRENNLYAQTAAYMFPPVRACEGCRAVQDNRLTEEEAGHVRFEFDRWRLGEDALRQKAGRLLSLGEWSDPDAECGDLPTEKIRCRAGSTTFWITCGGEMRPCGMMTTPSVPLLGSDFDTAWAAIRAAREGIPFPSACTSCRWKQACELCAASCYAENGCYEKRPDYLCRMMQVYLDDCRTLVGTETEGDESHANQ